MRLKGRQLRFLTTTLVGWSGLRATLLLWPVAGVPLKVGRALAPLPPAPAAFPPSAREHRLFRSTASSVETLANPPVDHAGALPLARDPDVASALPGMARGIGMRPPPTNVGEQPLIDLPVTRMVNSGASRWGGEAALFVRPGSGSAALAAGGQLGGSQAYARLTYRLNADGPVRFAVAARAYRPLTGKGGEVAAGLDWHPLPAIPLRLSIERRVALDSQGRNAWSAYAAGGFYAGHLPLGAEADGYAQAGVVGVARRDAFVDGALRAGRGIDAGPDRLVLGAGMWGAAQPGVSRLDIGPRASLTVAVANRSIVLALEDRMRIAGRARPGSGVAFTLAGAF